MLLPGTLSMEVLLLFFEQTSEGGTNLIDILQMRKLRLREVK